MAAKQTIGDLVPSTVLADWLNVSRITIIDLAAHGLGTGRRPLRPPRQRAGLCIARRALTGRDGEKAAAAIASERARLTHEQADHVALKNARARGTMVDAHEVEAEWSGVLRTVWAGMVAVPSRCGSRLAHLMPHDLTEIAPGSARCSPRLAMTRLINPRL